MWQPTWYIPNLSQCARLSWMLLECAVLGEGGVPVCRKVKKEGAVLFED